MVKREISKVLLKLSRQYPVVTLTGPRQSGKTTLVRNSFPGKPYTNLENIDQRELAINDPREFLKRYQKGAIIDEIQRAPSLLSYIQTTVDEKKIAGMFILTGSQNLNLLSGVSQSLAGRTAILKLLPFNFSEIANYSNTYSIDKLLVRGFFPSIYEKHLDPVIYYRNYIETYIERDLRQLINIKDLHLFQIFLKLCSGRVGQLLNASSLAGEVGVSSMTIKNWISILEASFIIMLMEPYFENINKRVVKSRKLYFTDVGLAAHLLGIETAGHVMNHPSRGALFENMVIMDVVKARFNAALSHNLYFYRDGNHNEVDVLFKSGYRLTPIEIKSAATFHSQFLNGLTHIRKALPARVGPGFLIYSGDAEQKVLKDNVVNYRNASKKIIGKK